jgi:hypothetical protein
VERHKLCIGTTAENVLPFNEKHKQKVLDLVQDKKRFKWAMPWDIDETWDKNAPEGLTALQSLDVDYVMLGWQNLWNDPQHIRVDGPMKCYRDKLYNLRSGRFEFMSAVVNGPTLHAGGAEKATVTFHRTWDVVCLHWGLMTRELREQHKARWDAVYGQPVCGGRNPYGIWDWALNEKDYPPRIEPNPYL